MGEQALTSRAACHEGFSDRLESVLFTMTYLSSVLAGKKTYSLICKLKNGFLCTQEGPKRLVARLRRFSGQGQLLVEGSAVSLRLREGVHRSCPATCQALLSFVRHSAANSLSSTRRKLLSHNNNRIL